MSRANKYSGTYQGLDYMWIQDEVETRFSLYLPESIDYKTRNFDVYVANGEIVVQLKKHKQSIETHPLLKYFTVKFNDVSNLKNFDFDVAYDELIISITKENI